MKIKVWLNSGANIHSTYSRTLDLEEEAGITSEEWSEMSDTEKEGIMREIAFECSDWGYEEVDQ